MSITEIPSWVLDAFAGLIMAIFIVSPVIASFYGLYYGSYALMREHHILLLESTIFPIIRFLSIVYYVVFIYVTIKKKSFAAFKNLVFLFFGFLVFWMLLSTFVNGWNTYAIYGDSYRNESVLSQICFFLVFFLISFTIKSNRIKCILVRLLTIISIYLSIISIVFFNTFKEDPFYKWKPSYISVFFNTNHYGYYLTVAIMLCAGMILFEKNKIWKGVHIIALIINTVVLSLNNTFGCWLACFATLIIQIIMGRVINCRFRKLLFLPMALFLITTLITGFWTNNVFLSIWKFIKDLLGIVGGSSDSGSAGSGRWKIWKATVELIIKKPFFGYGVEGTIANGLEDVMHNQRPHNEYLQYAFFYGIPAGLAYAAGCVKVLKDGIKRKHQLEGITKVCLIGTLGYLISALFGNTMFYTAPYLFIFMGLAFGGIQRDNCMCE